VTRKGFIAGLLIFLAVAVIVGSFISGKRPPVSKTGEQVGVIFIDGLIVGGSSQGVFGGIAGSQDIMKQVREAAEDATVKAVVLRINSPGGTVPATQEIAREVEKLKETGKVVVASMGDVGASGAFWIAAKTDKIYANPGTITGSIGVRMDYYNLEELYDKLGIEMDVIKSGAHKDIGSPVRDITPQERDLLQEMVDEMYAQFIDVVAEGRNLPKERVRELATGRIWTGSQAKELGLVDELGNYYDAIKGAAEMAGIRGKPSLKFFGKPSPLEAILGAGVKRLSDGSFIQQHWLYFLERTAGPTLMVLEG